MQDDSVNIDNSASLIPLQTATANQLPEIPFTPPPGSTFVSTISGQSGNVVLSGGTTGFSYTSGAGVITLTGTLGAANGGTGITSYSVGDLLYASAAATLAKLADVAAGSYLRSGGVNTAPLWSTTTLPNAATTGDILHATGANAYGNLADVATGNALISGGVGAVPSYGKIGLTTHISGILAEGNGGTNQSTYAQGDLLYASAANTLAKLAKDTNATRYLSNKGGSNAPQWSQVTLTDGVTGTLPIASGGTNDTGTAWTSYSPTVTTGSGTFTTTSTEGHYKTLGKTVWFRAMLTITTNGTAAGLIQLTLPFTAAAHQFSLCGAETATVGYALEVNIPSSGTTCHIRRYDADTTAYHANGVVLVVGGVYEQS